MFDHFFLQPRNSIHVEMEIVEPIGDEILGKFFRIFSFWHTSISVQRVSAKSVQSKTFRNFRKVGTIGLDCDNHFGQILVVMFDVLQILSKVSLLSFILLGIGTLVEFTKFNSFTSSVINAFTKYNIAILSSLQKWVCLMNLYIYNVLQHHKYSLEIV